MGEYVWAGMWMNGSMGMGGGEIGEDDMPSLSPRSWLADGGFSKQSDFGRAANLKFRHRDSNPGRLGEGRVS